MPTIKKSVVRAMFRSEAELARHLGMTRSAVNQWPEDIPEPRASQIREVARRLRLMRGDKVVARLALRPVPLTEEV